MVKKPKLKKFLAPIISALKFFCFNIFQNDFFVLLYFWLIFYYLFSENLVKKVLYIYFFFILNITLSFRLSKCYWNVACQIIKSMSSLIFPSYYPIILGNITLFFNFFDELWICYLILLYNTARIFSFIYFLMKIILKKCNQNDYAAQKELKCFCIISLVLIFPNLKSGITLFLIFLLAFFNNFNLFCF